MEGEEGGEGIRLSKRFNNNNKDNKNGEVDYKTKAGTAWSHSYLNQKPWHPLSYPNQRRKWIAEQTHAQRQRRAEEVSREYAQEQEFFRQTALISKKEKEKIEMMKAVSFMYVRPPGYNAESAKAAEIADEMKTHTTEAGASSATPAESMPLRDSSAHEKSKPRPKDAFGRPLPTEQEFEVLQNAPRMETGVPARVKPFGIEVRNVKCIRCGKYGHQSGDRECPLKDAIMPNEESRLKRDDPLTAIMAHTDPSEPLKWELKQKPGMSPPRGGFDPDDPNQQIVAEDIFDEYGGFLSGGNIPELLTNFPPSKPRTKSKKSKHRRESSTVIEFGVSEENGSSSPSDDGERISKKKKREKEEEEEEEEQKKKKKKKRKLTYSESSSSDDLEFGRRSKKSKRKYSYLSEDSDSDRHPRSKNSRHKKHDLYEELDFDRHHRSKNRRKKHPYSSKHSPSDGRWRSEKSRNKQSYSSDDSYYGRHRSSKDH